jgi:hypothetical protein
MTVNPDQVTVVITKSRKLLLDIAELIEAFNTELEIIDGSPRSTSVPAPDRQGYNATDIVPPFSVGDRVRVTNRVTTLPSLTKRQLSVTGARNLNLGVIVKITASRIHIKLDGHPPRIIQRHPSNVAPLT